MTNDLDTLVRQYIDGDLPAEREPDALRRIADDDEARALLRFELQVRAQGTPSVEVPDGFADRTMAAIAAAESEAAEPAPSPLAQLADRIVRWLVTPRTLQVRPGLAAAAAVLLVGVAIGLGPMLRPSDVGTMPSDGEEPVATTASSSPATNVAQEEDEVVWARFMYADDEASSVAVAGDFSEWEPIPLSSERVDGQTVWTGVVPVPKGEHQYMFVIDDSEWVTDPLAPVQRSDGFGNENAVLQL